MAELEFELKQLAARICAFNCHTNCFFTYECYFYAYFIVGHPCNKFIAADLPVFFSLEKNSYLKDKLLDSILIFNAYMKV